VAVEVVEVKGRCATGYKVEDEFAIEGFYIDPTRNMTKICVHALTSMASLLSPSFTECRLEC